MRTRSAESPGLRARVETRITCTVERPVMSAEAHARLTWWELAEAIHLRNTGRARARRLQDDMETRRDDWSGAETAPLREWWRWTICRNAHFCEGQSIDPEKRVCAGVDADGHERIGGQLPVHDNTRSCSDAPTHGARSHRARSAAGAAMGRDAKTRCSHEWVEISLDGPSLLTASIG